MVDSWVMGQIRIVVLWCGGSGFRILEYSSSRNEKSGSRNEIIDYCRGRLADGHLEDGAHLGVHGEALAHAHAE